MNRLPLLITTGILMASCSSIQENNELAECGTNPEVLMEATVDSTSPDYSPAKDPAILATVQMDNAESLQEGDSEGWKITFRNQIVGIGEIACLGSDGKIYLTTEGASLSLDVLGTNP